MEGLLTPVGTSYKASDYDQKDTLIVVSKAPEATIKIKSVLLKASSPEEALEILRNEPDRETLITTLRFLKGKDSGIYMTSPSPIVAQLVHVLISDTVPTYWDALHESQKIVSGKSNGKPKKSISRELELLLSCLRSVTGLKAVLLSLKQHIQQSRSASKTIGGSDIHNLLRILLQLLQALLQGNETVQLMWRSIREDSGSHNMQRAVRQEFLTLVGSGKLVGSAAEAEHVMNELTKKIAEMHWIAEGATYSLWLAANIVSWVKSIPTESTDELKSCGELLSKCLRLGYSDIVVKKILDSLLLPSISDPTAFRALLSSLPSTEQRKFLYTSLKIASKEYLSCEVTTEADSKWWQSDTVIVSAVAGLINLVMGHEDVPKEHLASWLIVSGAGAGEGVAIRRAAIAVLSKDKNMIELVLERNLQQLSDKLYIRHTPILQQEVQAQVLLLAAGCIHRKSPLSLAMTMRSGNHLSLVSNRLAASSPRVRFLGMAIGEALSSLVDKGDKKMDFKVDEMKTDEAKWYKSLVNVSDSIGSLEPLIKGVVAAEKEIPRTRKKPAIPLTRPSNTKIISIEEVETDEEQSDDNDLIPYAKPDSDAEDSDDDPTLITRSKPTAPVYIRDLITYLRDTENYDKQKLALSTAASLIRRKANFGTEVSAHAEELAALLVGLQDKYEIDNFQDMRLQGMIAVLIALPLKMGQWFSKTFFDGDYSISQRATVLTTIGLGARELGGFGAEDAALTATKPVPASTSFPSKTLPVAMHKVYTSSSQSPKDKNKQLTPLSTLSTNLENTMIAPLAASLADKVTGPSILKIRTFSSRMAVEKARTKPTTNALAKVVADGFFFPLTGRFFMHLKAYGSSSSNNITFQPYLLTLFIKTLALLLHASGPSTLSLPQMTSEFWDLLLGVRGQSVGDITVIEALLFGFLTILEVNVDRRALVDDLGRQMMETKEWVDGVFGRMGSGGGEEDERVRMLAAGVLVRIGEVVEKYQASLMGLG